MLAAPFRADDALRQVDLMMLFEQFATSSKSEVEEILDTLLSDFTSRNQQLGASPELEDARHTISSKHSLLPRIWCLGLRA